MLIGCAAPSNVTKGGPPTERHTITDKYGRRVGDLIDKGDKLIITDKYGRYKGTIQK
jgi:hypothetical protein